MTKFKIKITLTAVVPFTQLSNDDIIANSKHTYFYDVLARTRNQAKVLGLDAFHATVPIDELDNFDIEASIAD